MTVGPRLLDTAQIPPARGERRCQGGLSGHALGARSAVARAPGELSGDARTGARDEFHLPGMDRAANELSAVMAQTEVSRADVGLRSERGPVLLSVMLSVGLVAIDSTILATAVPSIVRDLGGFAQFPWLFSIYLLAAAVSVPVFAKFSDVYGRKPVMLVGIALFLLGSILCGFAWSMTALIIFRGAAGPRCRRHPADQHDDHRRPLLLAERAKVQGYVASVWAMSAVVGPDPRRRLLRLPDLALDLLRQHPVGRAGRLDAGPALPRGRQARRRTRSTSPAPCCSRRPARW